MSDRERRPSTIKASESLLEKQKIREEIKNSKKVSNNLKKLIEQEEAELDKSAVELLTISTELYGEEPDPQGIYTLSFFYKKPSYKKVRLKKSEN